MYVFDHTNLALLDYNLDERELEMIVHKMRLKRYNTDLMIRNNLQREQNLCTKLILAREYLTPQSILIEKIIKSDLCINEHLDAQSGDGVKNGVKYEIKVSIHDRESKFNFVQIRPDHDVDFYILVGYNLFEGRTG